MLDTNADSVAAGRDRDRRDDRPDRDRERERDRDRRDDRRDRDRDRDRDGERDDARQEKPKPEKKDPGKVRKCSLGLRAAHLHLCR